MKKKLISWIGRTDLRAVQEGDIVGLGPIAQAIRALSFDHMKELLTEMEQQAKHLNSH